MIVLGIILIVLGLLLPSLVPTFAFAHVVLVLGVILLIVGLLLAVMGRMGHAIGGRRHYYSPARVTQRPPGSASRAGGCNKPPLVAARQRPRAANSTNNGSAQTNWIRPHKHRKHLNPPPRRNRRTVNHRRLKSAAPKRVPVGLRCRRTLKTRHIRSTKRKQTNDGDY